MTSAATPRPVAGASPASYQPRLRAWTTIAMIVATAAALAGCASSPASTTTTVTNGSLHRTALGIGSPPAPGGQLVAELERLVDARPRSNPGSPSALAHGYSTRRW
jgi:hypothetical protein